MCHHNAIHFKLNFPYIWSDSPQHTLYAKSALFVMPTC